MMVDRPGRLWIGSIAISLAILLLYCIAMGYAAQPVLALTVVLVRIVAGYGVGFGLGLVVALAGLLLRRGSFIGLLLAGTAISGAATVAVLVAYNLLGGS